MAFTPYTGQTNIIQQLDDQPNDVGGLSPAQLKAKFDQFGTEFTEWFNNTHIAEANAHLAENMHHVAIAARNISVAGVQSISLPFKAKKIKIIAVIQNTPMMNIGVWAENGVQHRVSTDNSGNWSASSQIINLIKSGVWQVTAVVQNVSNTGFELNWNIITGSPTDIVNMIIVASTHY